MLHLLLSLPVQAHIAGFHDWPQHYESSADIEYWAYEDGWYISPVRTLQYEGSRLGLFVEKVGTEDLTLEARWVNADERSPWMTLIKTFEGSTSELWNQDLGGLFRAVQFRTQNPSVMDYIEWDLLTPNGSNSEEPLVPFAPAPPPSSSFLSQSLIDLGVISRTQWGAQATGGCGYENDWYRMAIHHVASQQTQNGSVAQKLQQVQAWAMSSGGYCDIPYQYLVGYDGTLFEGRPINRYSGATGGGNNDGNISISFVGCYDQSGCMSAYGFYNNETDVMMAKGRELVQALSVEHSIAVNSTNIKTHQDWPGNATACPGNFVINRFNELLSSVPYYYGEISALSHTEPIVLTEGEYVDVWVDVTNTGLWEWDTNTKIAPYPRDSTSGLYDYSWLQTTRVEAVSGTVSPGSTHRFSFRLYGNQVGTFTQHFTMLQEWFTWFGDTPYAGSPGDTDITFVVEVEPEPVPEPTSEPSTEPSSEPSTEPSSEPSSEINQPPIANAGIDQVVTEGDIVYLVGLGSLDPDGQSLIYVWNFEEETEMILVNGNTATPYFVASEVGTWGVQMTIFDNGLIADDFVIITVEEAMNEEINDADKRGCATMTANSLYTMLPFIALIGLRRRFKIRPQ